MAGIQADDIPKVNIWPRVGSVLTVVVVGITMVLSRTGLPFSDEDWLIQPVPITRNGSPRRGWWTEISSTPAAT